MKQDTRWATLLSERERNLNPEWILTQRLKCETPELSLQNPFLSVLMGKGETRLIAGTQVNYGEKEAESRQ